MLCNQHTITRISGANLLTNGFPHIAGPCSHDLLFFGFWIDILASLFAQNFDHLTDKRLSGELLALKDLLCQQLNSFKINDKTIDNGIPFQSTRECPGQNPHVHWEFDGRSCVYFFFIFLSLSLSLLLPLMQFPKSTHNTDKCVISQITPKVYGITFSLNCLSLFS